MPCFWRLLICISVGTGIRNTNRTRFYEQIFGNRFERVILVLQQSYIFGLVWVSCVIMCMKTDKLQVLFINKQQETTMYALDFLCIFICLHIKTVFKIYLRYISHDHNVIKHLNVETNILIYLCYKTSGNRYWKPVSGPILICMLPVLICKNFHLQKKII